MMAPGACPGEDKHDQVCPENEFPKAMEHNPCRWTVPDVETQQFE